MAAQLYYSPFIPAFSPNGLPVPGARLFFFFSGTDTLAPIYTNTGLGVRSINPVIADLAGRFNPVYLDSNITYRVRLVDAFGIQLGDDIDPYVPGQALKGPPGPAGTGVETIMSPDGSTYIGYQAPYSGATTQTAATAFNDLRLHSGRFVTAANSNGTTLNRVGLQAMIDAGDCEILARTYAIDDELIVPLGRKITIQPGARFIWRGSSPTRSNSKGFFRIPNGKGGAQITVNSASGGRAFFECLSPMPFVYTVAGYGVADVRVSGLNHYKCSGVFFDSLLGPSLGVNVAYKDVVIPTMVGTPKPGGGTYIESDVNVSRRIRVSDFEGSMPTFAAQGVGALLDYCDDVIIERGVHSNLYAGVQWEGGTASFAANAQGSNPDNLRKVTNITIRNMISRNVECGYWGAFGDTILVDGVEVYTAHDVALDSEGCWNTTFRNFKVRDGYNGGLAMFWFNRNIRFENGVVESTKKEYALARTYNPVDAPNNRDVTFQSVGFTCLDSTGLGTVDTGAGPVRTFNMLDCTLVNARIDVAGSNVVNLRTTTRLPIKSASAINIVSVRETQGGGNFAPPLASIEAKVYSEVAQPAGTVGIYATSSDPNSTPDHLIAQSVVRVPLDNNTQAGIRVVSSGRGSFPAAFTVRNNMIDGPIASSTSQGPAGLFDIQGNYNARGGVPPMG